MSKFNITFIAGVSAILAALLYTGVFTFLAVNFNYPQALDGTAQIVLPNLLNMGQTGRLVWVLYALISLLWIPIAVGVYQNLKQYNPGTMLLSQILAIIAGLSGTIGLARWSTLQWSLAELFIKADDSQKAIISTLFDAFNLYFGQFFGEFISEMSWSLFFVLVGLTLFKIQSRIKWFGLLTLFTGFIHVIAAFRNVWSPAYSLQQVINSILYLPIFLIIFGIVFIVRSGKLQKS
ncbi:MAG: DUF4386 family protein [bacterium]